MRSAHLRSALAFCCLLAAIHFATACAMPPTGIPASGTVYGQTVETQVDSELAAYYLEHFADWRQSDSEQAHSLAELPPCSAESLDRDALRQLSTRTSVDVAGLYAAQCLMESNRSLGREFDRTFMEIQALARPAAARSEGLLDEALEFAVVVVPGWDYLESGPITGADFARQLRQFDELGIASYRVPIEPHGGVEENAAVIRSEITRISDLHQDLILVSASSGSPAAALALGNPAGHQGVAHVRAWLNLGGILGGMQLIDTFSNGPGSLVLRAYAFLNGWDMDDVESMSAARSHARLATTMLPKDLVVINYIGIPFSGDISSRVSFFYSLLREHGPNDGLTLVTDPVLPGTHTIVALGQDHFFADDPELESRTLALTAVVGRAVVRKREEAALAREIERESRRLAQLERP
jgi:hypothetical protein